jgi:hypothetical protein
VDERVLPHGVATRYSTALDDLLAAMPAADLTFVVAGGDVLAADHLGISR